MPALVLELRFADLGLDFAEDGAIERLGVLGVVTKRSGFANRITGSMHFI